MSARLWGVRSAARLPASGPDHLPGPVRDARTRSRRSTTSWPSRSIVNDIGDGRPSGRPRSSPRSRRPACGPAARLRLPLPARAVRRPAPARRHRRRAGHGSRGDRRRRAGLDARRVDPDRAAPADARPARRARPDLPVHHPRPVAGLGHRRPDRGHVPRQDHGDRPGRGGHPLAAQPVHQGARVGLAVARAARRRDPGASGRSSRARRPTRPTSRPAAASIRAARWRSTAAGSRSRRCSTSAAGSRRRAGWSRRTSCRARPPIAAAAPTSAAAPVATEAPDRRRPRRPRRARRSASPARDRTVALGPDRIADLLAASAATVVAELLALGDDGRLATGARRVERERVRRPPHRGRATWLRRPDPDDPRRRSAGPAGRSRGAGIRRPSPRRDAITSARARSSPPSSTRCAPTGVRLVRGLGPNDLARVGHPPRRRAAARRRAPRRMGPPRPEPRPPDARRHPGPRLGPDGQRPPVLPRGPLAGFPVVGSARSAAPRRHRPSA